MVFYLSNVDDRLELKQSLRLPNGKYQEFGAKFLQNMKSSWFPATIVTKSDHICYTYRYISQAYRQGNEGP